MSVQFGRWNFENQFLSPQRVAQVKALLRPYGPDREMHTAEFGLDILYSSFFTTKESRREFQPHRTKAGAVLTWDGRLDNRSELLDECWSENAEDPTDVALVGAAFDHWGLPCFQKLLGDWALSIWDPAEHRLILAKDFLGTRHLYYAIENRQVTWSSILEPLVLFPSQSRELDEEYLAGWLSFFPATHLTPYGGIRSVRPSSYVVVRERESSERCYWSFDPHKQIRYLNDRDYEDQFRTLFSNSVRRRLRSDSPVLAELSGGLDSSSIVCMADALLQNGHAGTPRLDTVSYYDDAESSWDERPYFTKIEDCRGQRGCHIDVGSFDPFLVEFSKERPAVTPDSPGPPTEVTRHLADCLRTKGNRVLLSGIGGDEVLGGVPSVVPELADLLVRGSWHTLIRQTLDWSLAQRDSVWRLAAETVRSFLPVRSLGGVRDATWLNSEFVRRQAKALSGYTERFRLSGPRPSFHFSIQTLECVRRQLSCSRPSPSILCEKRYPYLDRELLEFLFAIPRGQILRPGSRRSLMRRALAKIVPNEVLHRKRKAFISQKPVRFLAREWSRIISVTDHMVGASLGLINPDALRHTLKIVREGKEAHFVFLMRTLALECWLRHITECGLHRDATFTS